MRKKRGWTQEKMQAHSGITRATWSNYENGNTDPDIQTIVKISGIFDVTLDDLILKDLENGNVNDNEKDAENGNVNGNLSGNLKSKKKGYFEEEEPLNSYVNEDTPLQTWTVLGQLKNMDEKIDRLLLLAEKKPPE